MKKYIITTMITMLLFGQAYFFGESDILALFFVFITAFFLYQTLIKLQSGNRKILSIHSKPGSRLYNFFTRETTIPMKIFVALLSFFTSSILVFLLKGIVIQQGYIPFFTVIIFSSMILYSFINKKIENDLMNQNINDQIVWHGSQLVRIFYAAIILNILLSLAFSAHDTYSFIESEVDFLNFADSAKALSIEKNDSNHYSRIFVNAYLIMDNIKLALANTFIELFEQQKNFYLFYGVIFILNIFKLLAFSVSIVMLQKGFEEIADKIAPSLRSFILNSSPFKLTEYFSGKR